MRPTAVLASALVRPAAVLTAAVPGGYGGGDGGDGKRGGDGEGKGRGGEGEGGGGEGGGGGRGGRGGGAGQVETVPETPSLVRVVAQVQRVPPPTKTLDPEVAEFLEIEEDVIMTVPA